MLHLRVVLRAVMIAFFRGPIWININYLAISALHAYSRLPGPSQQRCAELYSALRRNVMRNVLREFHSTGYLWEQYDDRTGQGIRGHPFSGWTVLVVNIMAEKY